MLREKIDQLQINRSLALGSLFGTQGHSAVNVGFPPEKLSCGFGQPQISSTAPPADSCTIIPGRIARCACSILGDMQRRKPFVLNVFFT